VTTTRKSYLRRRQIGGRFTDASKRRYERCQRRRRSQKAVADPRQLDAAASEPAASFETKRGRTSGRRRSGAGGPRNVQCQRRQLHHLHDVPIADDAG